MQGAEIHIGQRYGIRLKLTPNEPLWEADAIAKVGRGGRVKVRYGEASPHPGLEEYVHSRQIVVPWRERHAFLHDEERLQRVKAESRDAGDRVRQEAIDTVLTATGETAAFLHSAGYLSIELEAVRRIAQRAGLTGPILDLHSAAFVDRSGTLQLPFTGAERLTQAFAQAQSDSVTRYLDAEEEQYKAQGYLRGEHFWHDVLREHEPAFALVRQWAGLTQDRQHLRAEIQRLQEVVQLAITELDRCGATRAARRIERALQGQ